MGYSYTGQVLMVDLTSQAIYDEIIPDEIYERDTALDSITSCLKMTLLSLLEFICQKYLGQYRLMPITFIESWMALPVTIRQNRQCIIYEVMSNQRDPSMSQLLDDALKRITERKLLVNGRLLVARLRGDP